MKIRSLIITISRFSFVQLKSFLEDIDRDYKRLKNETEIEILSRQIQNSNRLSFVVCGQVVIVFLVYIVFLLVPTLLQSSYYQLHYLHFIGYFYNEHSRTNDLVCLQIVLSGLIGILAIASTEATFGVYGFYLSALFQIVSYRIRKAVDDSAMLISPGSIDLRSAVIMHQRAFKLVLQYGDYCSDILVLSLDCGCSCKKC
ncbi:uncharacterized protein LOC143212641 [Lasioglossum baleicum]|uniref:uncharacterized protein LOC143212641 n=1 Tax=Lasioglossum baleicum TaxID=434251 RepID=UPI003FCE2DEF